MDALISPVDKKKGPRRYKIASPRTDMTPMVDLGFLLISFFIFTSQLSEPKALNLNMPVDGPPITLGESSALTILLAGNNKVFYYEGDWKTASENNQVFQTSFSSREGLRQVIINKQKVLEQTQAAEGRDGLMMLIKSSGDAAYRNLVDVLDEALINDVKKYAVLKMDAGEKQFIGRSGSNNQ